MCYFILNKTLHMYSEAFAGKETCRNSSIMTLGARENFVVCIYNHKIMHYHITKIILKWVVICMEKVF